MIIKRKKDNQNNDNEYNDAILEFLSCKKI